MHRSYNSAAASKRRWEMATEDPAARRFAWDFCAF
jgi:hypothetical protein